ncbi:MAG: bifunctional 2-polyprenyl-6-hydroxyphenol methylase/3-demethylubiquinol 3-O-methyltransferase UbiG [Pseudomonadota bacterium]
MASPSDLQPAEADPDEVARFAALAEEWWDPNGPMAPLHRQGPARLAFLRSALSPLGTARQKSLKPLAGLTVLDLGCGGGLVSEPLARLGASVTAIDATAELVEVARRHAEEGNLDIDYRCTTAEALVESGAVFDAVVSLEVIEHVPEPEAFLSAATSLLRPGGVIAVSTLNRTRKSFALAIVGAEYILRWLPRGTHNWRRFLKPSEIARLLRAEGCQVTTAKGIVYNPLDQGWRLSDRDLDVNYILAARKAG